MDWSNLPYNLILCFLVSFLLHPCCRSETPRATRAPISAVSKSTGDALVPLSGGGFTKKMALGVNIVKTQIPTHSRTLKQRRDDLQLRDEVECALGSSERRRYFDLSTQEWVVTNEVLQELDNDIQAIVNCTSENDVVVFRLTRVIRPDTTITLPWNLILRSDSSVTFTCPQRGPLLVTSTPSITLENLVIEGCNGTSSVIVLSPRCDGNRSEDISLLNHLTFQDNGVFGQGHLIEASGQCSRLNITGLVFLRNRCVGTHCVVLGVLNTMRDVHLVNNQGSNDISLDSSIISAPQSSETMATNVTSEGNEIRSFQVLDGAMSITDSQFSSNARNQLSLTRDNSTGGGVLFANSSSVAITNTIFERNYALNGGGVFARSSNITIAGCTFRDNDAGEGYGGALYGHHSTSFAISSCQFSRNRGYRGAGLYSNHTSRVDIVNSRFLENYSSRSCGVCILNGTANIRSSEFSQNNADRAGAALCAVTTKLSLKNSNFSENNASFGGACMFEYNSTIRGSALLFENNTASATAGGGISFNVGGRMTLRDSLFRNNYASSDGGAIYTTYECYTVLKRVVFLNNTSEDYAGALQIWRGNFSGSDLTFERNRAANHGGAISFYEATNVSVSRSHFERNEAAEAGALQFYLTVSGYLDQCTFVRNFGFGVGGGALFATASNLNILFSFFRANNASNGGSINLASFCNSTILNSRFVGNTAEGAGGAIFAISNSRLLLSNASFTKNRGDSGGALVAMTNSIILGSHMEFEENYASSAGGLQLADSVVARISNSLFSNNTADNGGGAIDSFDNCQVSIQNSTFEGNSGGPSGGGLRAWSNSSLVLASVSFDTNEARRGGALFLTFSSIARVSNCSFTKNTAINSGGAVGVYSSSTLTLTNSTLSENTARFGGGFYVENNSTTVLSYNNFERNSASGSGGAVYLQTSFMLLFSIWSEYNRAIFGGFLIAYNASLEMTNSTIRRNRASQAGGAIALSETNATLQTIRMVSNEAQDDGGGIYARDASRVNATNIDVVSNIARDAGGGIALGNASSLLCFSCLVMNNTAFSGAGIFAFSNNSIPIVAQLQDSRFENNSASSFGGGIYLAAPQNRTINCTDPNVTCGRIILLNTSFGGNYATHSGAIVLTASSSLILVDCEYRRGRNRRNQDFLKERDINSLEVVHPRRLCSSWRRNRISSMEYGNVVGTFGQEILLTIDPEDEVRLVRNTTSGYVLENVKSGTPLPAINVTILDEYGIGPAPTRPTSFLAILFSPNDFTSGFYYVNIVAGFGNVSRIIGLVSPGNYTLTFSFDNPAFESFNVTVIVRDCLAGEEPTFDRLTCQECDDFSYNFNTSEVGGCKECPNEATCEGRFIVPKSGQWNKSPCHDTIQECLVEEACTYKNRHQALANLTQNSTDCGFNETALEAYNDALCNEGYKGPLCGSCKTSFGLSSRFLCLRCSSTFVALLTLLAITVYLLAASTLNIRGGLPVKRKRQGYKKTLSESSGSSKSSNEDPEMDVEMANMQGQVHVSPQSSQNSQVATASRSQAPPSVQLEAEFELTRWKLSEMIKITLNFFQTIATAATVSVQWTNGLLVLFEASEYVGGVTTTAVSGPVDCFTSSSSATARAIWRMLVSLFVPGVVLSILFSVWGINALRKKKSWPYFLKRATLSVIAVTYVSYLGLTEMGIRAFYCVDVYDSSSPSANSKEAFWAGDTAIKCYGKDHGRIIAIGVLVLAVISVLFPLISVVVLYMKKEDLNDRNSWIFATSGFLFRAFKERCFFWETLVMFRKACLSVIVVFSYPLGGDIQGLLTSLLLFFSLYLHFTMKPYREEFKLLNHLEALSLFVSGVTFNLALFFIDGRCSDAVRTLLAVLIIVGNLSFVVCLLIALFYSYIIHWEAALAWESIYVPDNAPWWRVIKIYVTSRAFFQRCLPKKRK